MADSKAILAAVAIAVATAALSAPALADRGRHGGHSAAPHYGGGHAASPRHFHSAPRVSVYVGVPVAAAAPFYYAAPRYYAPPPVYVAQAPAPAYWYYCPAYNDYYPRVQQCPVAWQRVFAQPPAYYPG